eukprot:gene30308-39533_t
MDELTEEQRKRIEQNKKLALEKLAKRHDAMMGEIDISNKPKCQTANCKSENIDVTIYEIFGENICSVCKLKSNDFELISKSEVQSSYLIPIDTIKMMKFSTKNNHFNSHWAPIHLYLRKHAKERAEERFGSYEAMEREKKIRESKKFDRENAKTEAILTSQTKDFKSKLHQPFNDNAMHSENSSSTEPGSKRRDGIDSSKLSKKRKTDLHSLVSCFRGEDV